MDNSDERNVNPVDEMARIAEDILNLNSQGFKETYRSNKPGKLIFDSPYCRVSLIWGGWDYLGGNSMQIFYGRLHAPNEGTTMIWMGEECRCWHRVEYVLHFLDGRAPNDAAKLGYSHPITDPFYEEEQRKKFDRRQPEWLAHMEKTVWQHYGQSLFDLFDLRQPDLWQQYRQFLKEVYDVAGRKPRPGPPMDKVC